MKILPFSLISQPIWAQSVRPNARSDEPCVLTAHSHNRVKQPMKHKHFKATLSLCLACVKWIDVIEVFEMN